MIEGYKRDAKNKKLQKELELWDQISGDGIDGNKPPITLTQIQTWIKNKQFDKFYRRGEIQKKYDEFKTQPNFLEDLKSKLEKGMKHGKQRWVIRRNDYPYHFEKGLEHWIVWDIRCPYSTNQDWKWTKSDFALNSLNKSSLLYPFRECLWWINPPQFRSINDIPHIHLVKVKK